MAPWNCTMTFRWEFFLCLAQLLQKIWTTKTMLYLSKLSNYKCKYESFILSEAFEPNADSLSYFTEGNSFGCGLGPKAINKLTQAFNIFFIYKWLFELRVAQFLSQYIYIFKYKIAKEVLKVDSKIRTTAQRKRNRTN